MRILFANPYYGDWHRVKSDRPENPYFFRTGNRQWLHCADGELQPVENAELEAKFQAICPVVVA